MIGVPPRSGEIFFGGLCPLLICVVAVIVIVYYVLGRLLYNPSCGAVPTSEV